MNVGFYALPLFFMNCHRTSVGGQVFNKYKALAEIIKEKIPYCFS